jgi:hypothetical protein
MFTKEDNLKAVNPTVQRNAVLKATVDNLGKMETCLQSYDYGGAALYASKARALIELLELDDCGSIGGFDKERHQSYTPQERLRHRYLWLRDLPQGVP